MRRAALAFALLLATPPALAIARAEETAPTAPDAPDAKADREFAQSNYPAAENWYRQALAAKPDDIHSLSRLALLLTWRGRYEESIALYRTGLDKEPANNELRRGLATALTWSERYDKAITLYRQMLAERPGDEGLTFEMAQAQAWSGDNAGAMRTLHDMVSRNPRHVKARLLLAQVHDWSGEPAAAEKIYRSLLAEDPDNVAALAGLGDALVAQGREEEALASYDRALSIDPKDRTALEGRARAFQSQGRTSQALDAVRQALELYPDARDARRLGRAIGGPLRPALQMFASTTQDSDDNDLSLWGGSYTHHLGGRGEVGVSFTHAQAEATAGLVTPEAHYDTLRVTGAWHAPEHFSLYGELGPERTEIPVNTDPNVTLSDDSRQHLAGSLTFEVDAAEWFTLVGSSSEERLVGTAQAFMNDVGMAATTLTTIFRPHPTVKIRLSGQKARFTDDDDFDVDPNFLIQPDAASDNSRDLLSASASWKLPLRRPRITLSLNHRRMGYERDLHQGYFAPDRYVSETVGLDISDVIGRRFYWGAGLDAGLQTIRRFGDETVDDNVLNYRLLGGINIGDTASLEAYYARSDLALQSAAGFKSDEGGVRLVFRFGESLGPASPARRVPVDGNGAND